MSGPLRTRISPHSAIALASRRPQRGHRGPPVPREMFQAFPGDYDSGSRCSSSPSAESQYLSSVDSFGSPPTAAASQVRSRSQRCYFGGHGGNASLSVKCELGILSHRTRQRLRIWESQGLGLHFGFCCSCCCLQTARTGRVFATGCVRRARERNAARQALAMPGIRRG